MLDAGKDKRRGKKMKELTEKAYDNTVAQFHRLYMCIARPINFTLASIYNAVLKITNKVS